MPNQIWMYRCCLVSIIKNTQLKHMHHCKQDNVTHVKNIYYITILQDCPAASNHNNSLRICGIINFLTYNQSYMYTIMYQSWNIHDWIFYCHTSTVTIVSKKLLPCWLPCLWIRLWRNKVIWPSINQLTLKLWTFALHLHTIAFWFDCHK